MGKTRRAIYSILYFFFTNRKHNQYVHEATEALTVLLQELKLSNKWQIQIDDPAAGSDLATTVQYNILDHFQHVGDVAALV